MGIKVKKIKMPGIGRVFIFFGVFGVMMTLQYIQQVYQFDFLLNSILIIFSISIVLSLIDFIFIKEGKTYIRNLLFGVIYVLTTIPILILL
ncbi:hypothetical protein BACCIP111883_04389 [Sutcliffiella rhizosphaerae]|uniref:DUF3953 domain-containing protein n=1 Tax=Sutcliffiella rhizosphaerae TaxID=2880967 RepID=A0ABN8AHG2_9BACI|nr:hypothetical protein BACCIP111883_04389 [Sutcliffiella rhizosphaerae]